MEFLEIGLASALAKFLKQEICISVTQVMLQPQILIGPICAALLLVDTVSTSGKGGFRDTWLYLLTLSGYRFACLQLLIYRGFMFILPSYIFMMFIISDPIHLYI